MKILHTSDLHLGKKINEVSMLAEQRFILDKILDIVDREKPDCVIIAGDVYDKTVPSGEAVTVFDEFLTTLSAKALSVFVISGNHDSAERMAFGSRLMEKNNVYISPVFNGEIKPIKLFDNFGAVNFYLLPFIKAANARRFFEDREIKSTSDAMGAVIENMDINEAERNILVAHQFVTGALTCDSEEISVGGTDEIDYRIFKNFDYTALGHIHGPQKIGQENIRYSGTPLKYSFSEVRHKKSLTVIEAEEKGSIKIDAIPLEPEHDMREIKGSFEELMLKKNYESTNTADYLHITLTDEEDVIDAIQKLRLIYSNLLRLDYDNTRTRTQRDFTEAADIHLKNPVELFDEFYEKQNGKPMASEQRSYVVEVMEKTFNR